MSTPVDHEPIWDADPITQMPVSSATGPPPPVSMQTWKHTCLSAANVWPSPQPIGALLKLSAPRFTMVVPSVGSVTERLPTNSQLLQPSLLYLYSNDGLLPAANVTVTFHSSPELLVIATP